MAENDTPAPVATAQEMTVSQINTLLEDSRMGARQAISNAVDQLEAINAKIAAIGIQGLVAIPEVTEAINRLRYGGLGPGAPNVSYPVSSNVAAPVWPPQQ